MATTIHTIELGTAVYLTILRYPIHIAHETTTVDQLSRGCLSMGVSVGVRQPERREMEQFSVDYNQRRALFNKVLNMITALWSSETVTYNGEFYTL